MSNENPEYLLKFVSKEEHAKVFQNGIMYTRPAGYYRYLENGRGDEKEASVLKNSKSIKMYKCAEYPIYCMYSAYKCDISGGYINNIDIRCIENFEANYIAIIKFFDMLIIESITVKSMMSFIYCFESEDDENSDTEIDQGCYVTTACVTFQGFSDDCNELQVLRQLRDRYVINLQNGTTEIEEYYSLAPQIIVAINKLNNRSEIYDQIYKLMILKCVNLIENKNDKRSL